MQKKISFCLLFLSLLASVGNLAAQNIVHGIVKDAEELFALPYAQVKINGELALTDENGKFRLSSKKDSCNLEISYSNYQTFNKLIIFNSKKHEVRIDAFLLPKVTTLQDVSVTASKYETNPEKSTNSLVVVQPKALESKNLTTVDEVLNTAPGVAIVDNEPQIRGGSGFSSGMGSRVLILLDNIPMLRPDAGRPMWNFMPLEDVEQIEILKGASSVVFGSSAITGAINVLSAYPRSKPKTKVTISAGMYDKPTPSYRTSWIHQNPIKYGVSFLHSRIIKKNFDFVIGGEYYDNQGYIGPEERISVTRNKNGDDRGQYEKRARINFATRYRFAKVKGLNISLNGNFMYNENAQSFFWYDADTNRFRSYDGSLSKFKNFMFYIDPSVQYATPAGWVHTFRNRLLYSDNQEITGLQSATSFVLYDEYQFNKKFKRIGLNLVGGIVNMYSESYGPCFDGDNYGENSATRQSDNLAIYAQLEESFLKEKNLTLSLGGRWEYYKIDDQQDNKPIFKAGINYQIPKVMTAFRASFGQGFRYPSIGEKFIALSVGRYGFYPNPDLVPETSWNVELGIMQPFKIGKGLQGVFDIAGYYQDYKNYIEFCMGPWGTQGAFMNRFGFKFINIGEASISGVDMNLMGGGEISKNVSYSFQFSYTYSHPIAKDLDKVYFSYNHRDYTFHNNSSDTTRNVLKYRIEHMAKFDVEFTFWKVFGIGFTASYYSAMKNVDKFFFNYDEENPELSDRYVEWTLKPLGDLPFKGFYNLYHSDEYQRGSWVFDARLNWNIKNVTLSFVVKNLFNKAYTLRPLYSEPTRTYNIQFVYHLN